MKKWRPAVAFEQCYLSVYHGKDKLVYLTREAYYLMGKPRRIMVFPAGKSIALSPALKYGSEVKFADGQPFISSPEASRIIGPGNRAYYSYDEFDYDYYSDYKGKYPYVGRNRKNRKRNRWYFYFRVNRSAAAAPATRPANPATM